MNDPDWSSIQGASLTAFWLKQTLTPYLGKPVFLSFSGNEFHYTNA